MKVLTRIIDHGSGWMFTPSDFADLGTSQAIRLALMRAEKEGRIRRLARGLYDVPREDPELGKLPPSPDAIATALQTRDATRWQPTGACAVHLLGLADHVPAKLDFFTDGSSRTVQVGDRQIVLKRRSGRVLATAGRLGGLVIHALDYLGEDRVDEVLIDHLREKLTEVDRAGLLDDVRYAPAWIGDILRTLATEASESMCRSQFEAPTAAEEDVASPPPAVEDTASIEAKFPNGEVVGWQALGGSASTANDPPVHMIVQGHKPARKTPGRKRNLFAPKSSRVVHWLLLHSGRDWTAQEVGAATGVDSGHLSRILARLIERQLIQRDGRTIHLPRPGALLEAWREAYTPPCRNVLKGVIRAKSGREVMATMEMRLRAARRRYAFGGLGAAYLWGGQGDFHLVTCYLEGKLSPQLKWKLRFVEVEGDAANVWIMEHADQVAFLGSERRSQTQIASAAFTYVDLASHPGESKEAVKHLRERVLGMWPT